MKTILESYNQRQLDILYLLYSSNDWITTKEISTLLKVTKQTINNDIKKLNNLDNEKTIIETSLQSGVKIGDMSIQYLNQLRTSILKQSTAIKFMQSIFFHPDKNINYHANRLYTSRSTLHRNLSHLNRELAYFDIHIKQSHKGLFLYSNQENELRRFLAILLHETFGFDNSRFINSSLLTTIDNQIQQIFSFNSYTITGDSKTYLQNLYYVSLLRESQQFNLEVSKHFDNKLRSIKPLKRTACSKLKQMTDEDLARVDYFLLDHLSESTISSKDKENLKLIETDLRKTFANNLIETDENSLSTFISSLKMSYLTVTRSFIPNILIYDQHQTFTDEVKKNYPNLLKLIFKYVHQLEDIIETSLFSYINSITFNLFTCFPDIVDVSYSEDIMIVSSHSLEHANFLKKIICNKIDFNSHYSHHLICTTTQDDYYSTEPKLIITNSNDVHTTHSNSFLVNNFPSQESLTQLKRYLAILSMSDSDIHRH